MKDEHRNLLDFAAKAAGITIRWHEADPDENYWDDGTWCYIPDSLPPNDRRKGDKDSGTLWNPIADSQDSLELAVTLGLCISHWPNHTPPHVMVGYRTGPNSGNNLTEDYGDNAVAATRLAIVKAAAEVGESLDKQKP